MEKGNYFYFKEENSEDKVKPSKKFFKTNEKKDFIEQNQFRQLYKIFT